MGEPLALFDYDPTVLLADGWWECGRTEPDGARCLHAPELWDTRREGCPDRYDALLGDDW